MIEITKTHVDGFEAAFRGMRNPMDSWERSDSLFGKEMVNIGEKDMELAKKLIHGGSVHSKFLRMINVTADVKAPQYWWGEYDTYKVGTVANSCSKMHRIHAKPLTLDDFSHDHMSEETLAALEYIIVLLNGYREKFNETKDKENWWQMIQMLPMSYNQLRTVQLNYEVLRNIYRWRKDHKLDEWHVFCDWIRSLPYSELITEGIDNET